MGYMCGMYGPQTHLEQSPGHRSTGPVSCRQLRNSSSCPPLVHRAHWGQPVELPSLPPDEGRELHRQIGPGSLRSVRRHGCVPTDRSVRPSPLVWHLSPGAVVGVAVRPRTIAASRTAVSSPERFRARTRRATVCRLGASRRPVSSALSPARSTSSFCKIPAASRYCRSSAPKVGCPALAGRGGSDSDPLIARLPP